MTSGGELPGGLLVDGEPADQVALAQQRDAQQRPGSRPQQDVAEGAVVRAGLGDVGDLDRLVGHGHAVRRRLRRVGSARAGPRRPPPRARLWVARSRELLGLLVVLVDRARVGAGQLVRARDDRGEHGLEVERRAEGLADLPQSLQLADRAGQLGGCASSSRVRSSTLLLEVRVRRLELPGRPVELVAERLELVAGPDLDAMAEVAGADPRRALLEHPDRRDHAPGEEDARQDRQPEAEHEDDGAADDRGPEGRVRVRGGALDEHEPPERQRSPRAPRGPARPRGRRRPTGVGHRIPSARPAPTSPGRGWRDPASLAARRLSGWATRWSRESTT